MIHPPPCYFWNSTKCIRTISWLCAKNRLLAAHKAKVCVLQQEGKWHLGLSSSVCTVGLSLHRVKNSAREINKKEGGREGWKERERERERERDRERERTCAVANISHCWAPWSTFYSVQKIPTARVLLIVETDDIYLNLRLPLDWF